MTPATLRAFIGTLLMTPAELSRAPGKILATLLEVTPQRANTLLDVLVEQGLLYRAPGKRPIQVIAHRRGSVIHCHGPEVPCPGIVPLEQSIRWAFPDRKGMHPGGGMPPGIPETTPPRIPSFPETSAQKPQRNPHVTSKEEQRRCGCIDLSFSQKEGVMKERVLFRAYLLEERGAAQLANDDLFLAALYERKRQGIDPLYEAGERTHDIMNLRKAARALKARRIHPRWWPDYVDWIWEKFSEVTKGRGTFPPSNLLASPWYLDNYQSERPQRLNVPRARAMLVQAGHKDVPAGVVISVCRDMLKKGSIPVGLSEEIRSAVRWLAPRLREVGYVGMEPPKEPIPNRRKREAVGDR